MDCGPQTNKQTHNPTDPSEGLAGQTSKQTNKRPGGHTTNGGLGPRLADLEIFRDGLVVTGRIACKRCVFVRARVPVCVCVRACVCVCVCVCV